MNLDQAEVNKLVLISATSECLAAPRSINEDSNAKPPKGPGEGGTDKVRFSGSHWPLR